MDASRSCRRLWSRPRSHVGHDLRSRSSRQDSDGTVGQTDPGRSNVTPGMLGMGAGLFDKPRGPRIERAGGAAAPVSGGTFLPRRRFVVGLADFNAQFGSWLVLADNRIHRCRGGTREIGSARTEPRLAPSSRCCPTRRGGVRLARDHWLRVGTSAPAYRWG